MAKTISTVAKNIKKHRQAKGLSQDKLSRMADVSHATIIKIESGVIQSPTINTVQKIAKALGVSLDNLLK
jgi:transcriptional regulator with XRE-family HTH domain